jgi:NAD(P)-dependent dehydrogenase (short-subunit alcohol dehydrogenase family)
MTPDDLSGRGVLITGAGRGIGRAAALHFARAGAKVALASRTVAELTLAAEEILAAGGEAFPVPADVSDPEEVAELVRRAEQATGGVDVLISNAGILGKAPVDELAISEWRRVLDVNLTAAFLLARELVPRMRARRRGRLIFVSSISASRAGPNYAAYAASKAGLLGLCRSLSEELRPDNIQAMAISPGSVDTQMLREGRPDLRPDMSPEDIARALYFLAVGPPALTGAALDIFG